MTLTDLASLGSFVSGVAVLTSLIYLALQVRQTERNQQVSIRHSRASRIVQLELALADPAVAVAWRHGQERPEALTDIELTQFIRLCRALFFHFEDSFYQRREGVLNDAAFETVQSGARFLARSPGVRVAWKLVRPNFAGGYRTFMDDIVGRAAREPPVDTSLETWRTAFAAEVSPSG